MSDAAARSNVRVLSEVRPGDIRVEHRHAKTAAYVRGINSNYRARTQYAELWEAGYRRFGDIFEQTLRSLKNRPKTEEFVAALPDPWMVTGHLVTELSDEWLAVWNRFLVPNRAHLLYVMNDPMPARSAELLAWLGKKKLGMSSGSYNKDGGIGDFSSRYTWANIFGYNVAESETYVSDRNRHSVTEEDLYTLMDAGVRAPIDIGTGTLQEQVARVRGTYTDERRALSQVTFKYPPLSPDDAERYPLTATFVESTKDCFPRALGPVDPAKVEALLVGAEELAPGATRERLAYGLENASDIDGGTMNTANRLMWEACLEYSEKPEERFFAVSGTHGTVDEVEMIVSWMAKHMRPATERWDSWLTWVMQPAEGKPALPILDESAYTVICDIIRAGASWEELQCALAVTKLTLEEAVEVLVNGMPVEYVVTMRPPTAVAPF